MLSGVKSAVYSDLAAHAGPVTYRESLGLLPKQKPPNTFGDLGLGEAASKRLALPKHSFTALQDHQKNSEVLRIVLSPDATQTETIIHNFACCQEVF